MSLTRRQWLKSMGLGAGSALCGPLLERIALGAESPRRFVLVVEGNGYEPVTVTSSAARAALGSTGLSVADRRWWYRQYRHDTPVVVSDDLSGAPALDALAAVPELANQTSVVLGLSSRIVGGGHSAYHGALSSSRTVGGSPGGPTLDALLAANAEVRGTTPFDCVRLGVQGGGSPLDFKTCAYDKGRSAPMILQPSAAFASLFGSVGDAASQLAFARRQGLLDYAKDEVRGALARFSGSSRERQKLETYLASLETLTERHQRLLGLGSALQTHAPAGPDTNPLYVDPDPLDKLAAQAELATAALKGGLTNVAVLGSGTGGAFSLVYRSVSSVGRHDLQHGSAGNPTYLSAIHEVTRRQVAILARMAADLAATPEGDGSMLDNTVIVYVGDNGEQHHSTASEFPAVVIGGKNLGHHGGRTVIYPGLSSSGHRQLSNLWNTVGSWGGLNLEDFGTEGPSRRALGPLSELG